MCGYGEGAILAVSAVNGVELGAERAAAQGPKRVAPAPRIGQCTQKSIDAVSMPQRLRIARPVIRGPVQFMPVSGVIIHRPLMEPGPGEQRRREMLFGYRLEARLGPMGARGGIIGEGFGGEMFDHSEAAGLALPSLPVGGVDTV